MLLALFCFVIFSNHGLSVEYEIIKRVIKYLYNKSLHISLLILN